MNESTERTVWACGYCGNLYYTKDQADLCHNDRVCGTCGKQIGKESYFIDCEDCRTKKKILKTLDLFEKAEKLTIDEYIEKFPNYYACTDGDKYFAQEDWEYEFEEREEKPSFIWGTTKHLVTLDPYSIIQDFEEKTEVEDYEMDKEAVRSICEFCESWNEKHAQEVFMKTTKIAILLQE